VLRATGANSDLAAAFGHRPAVQRAIGLALANGMIGASGALVSAQQGFADINMGAGAVVTFIAALVIGEELLRTVRRGRPLSLDLRLLAAFIGATLYFFLFLLVLQASWFGAVAVSPTDLKLLSALLVALAIAIRRRPSDREDLIPL
jgi:putative ABC transport system permease protein